MPRAPLLDREGKRVGDTDLPENAFGITPNPGIVHQYLEYYLDRQHQRTRKTKTRNEVSGGGRKPWRQKGTGRARVGSIRSPLWRHGGITFGPRPGGSRKRLPRKMRKLALASVLSSRVAESEIYIIEDIDTKTHKTAALKSVLREAELLGNKVLIVTTASEPGLVRAGNNLPGVRVTFTGELNPYDALSADSIIIISGALPKIEELCSK